MLPLDSRRSSIQIAAEILRLLRLGEAGKTEVMYVVKLTHGQTENYLNWLRDLGLLTEAAKKGRPKTYTATRDGLELLSSIEALQEMLQRPETLRTTAPGPPVREKGLRRVLTRLGRLVREG